MSETRGGELVLASSEAVLPDIVDVERQVIALIADGNSDVLDEVRRRAEAAKLYEQRSGNVERERHFARLRLLAEAGIGALAFDDPDVLKGKTVSWKTLGCALERGALLDAINQTLRRGATQLASASVATTVSQMGLTHVPAQAVGGAGAPLPWARARLVARENGIALDALPTDKTVLRRNRERTRAASQRLKQVYAAAEREDRRRRQRATTAAVAERGPHLAKAYGHVRKALDALQAATDAREIVAGDHLAVMEIERCFRSLYEFEDALGRALKAS